MDYTANSFQKMFFDYQIPLPFKSVYHEHFIKSNDLRLLLEIATQSTLRMYTDPKSGNLHFICKKKGANCFDIEAEPHRQDGYYFTYDYLQTKHKANCIQKNECLWYLTIYNLMKIKKNLIKEYMVRLNVEQETPSLILSKLSGSADKYFFQSYINGHIELKRKLRKKFDNVVNIDIKKIGKEIKEEQSQEVSVVKMQPSVGKNTRQKKEVGTTNSKAKQKKTKRVKKTNKKKRICRKRIRRQQQPLDEQPGSVQISPYKKPLDLFQQYVQPQKSDCKQEQRLLQYEVLPEIQVLDEQGVYIWSDSDQEYQYEQNIGENSFNPFNYFQSITNSALKISLDQHSLQNTLFSTNIDK